MISSIELGWIIGLLEGEGHFGFSKHTQVVSLRMIDRDTVSRAAQILGQITGKEHVIGQIGQPVQPRQEIYYIQIYGNSARTIMKTLVRYMCSRRRQQIWRALNRYTPPKLKIT